MPLVCGCVSSDVAADLAPDLILDDTPSDRLTTQDLCISSYAKAHVQKLTALGRLTVCLWGTN